MCVSYMHLTSLYIQMTSTQVVEHVWSHLPTCHLKSLSTHHPCDLRGPVTCVIWGQESHDFLARKSV
jgi:hypothetical protein